MATFEETHAARQAEVERLEQQANDRALLYFVYAERRDLISCEANSNAILAYFNGEPLTPETLRESLEHPALKNQLAWQTTDQDRAKLEKAIRGLLAGSPEAIKNEIAKFKYKNVQELSAWHDDLVSKKEAREKSPEELREIIQQQRDAQPASLPVEYTKETLLRAHASELRKLAGRYGFTELNKRLSGK